MRDPGAFAAVVLAGDRRPDDPVARAAGVPSKSLVPVGGRAMVLRVLDALGASRQVGTRVLCGPERSMLAREAELGRRIGAGQIAWVEPRATPSLSAASALETVPAGVPVLLTTADHALLRPDIVDYFCAGARAADADVAVGVTPYELVKAAYPDTRRTAIRLRDGAFCGSNLFAFLTPASRTAVGFWRRVEQERKRPLRLVAGALGWVAVLRYGLGRMTLDEGLARVSGRMGLRVAAVTLPFPEAAVDVDTLDDLRLVRAIVGDGAPSD
ncbi:MAG: nucleotidyltransferase family protein [Candidatus Rokubacteria bacterium]|nr:nucleotidyltransferase family protein [Candidatus Rokubacteria bacterium]